MKLTASERKQLIRLLGLLQTHLESRIYSAAIAIAGTDEAALEDKPGVREDRGNWQLAGKWIKWLERRPPIIEGKPGPPTPKPKSQKRRAGGKA
jgi:hypothetical protein